MSSKSHQQADTTQKSSSIKGSYRVVVQPYKPAYCCSVCDAVLCDDVDMKNFLEYGACTDCVDTYYYPNAAQWDAGWRPDLRGKENDI